MDLQILMQMLLLLGVGSLCVMWGADKAIPKLKMKRFIGGTAILLGILYVVFASSLFLGV